MPSARWRAARNRESNLERFVEAQEPVIERVLAELRAGRKTSHWMWFVFPQIQGLGRSPMAERFALSSRAEAEAYLGHPVLGPRLRECTRLVNEVAVRGIDEILGLRPRALSPQSAADGSNTVSFSSGRSATRNAH
jgi:uncharacterized protein (DUF1810 family)